MIYILDTDSLIFIIRGLKNPTTSPRRAIAEKVVNKIKRAIDTKNAVGISAITKAELKYGIARADNSEKEQDALEKILSPFDEYDFDAHEAAKFYGIIRNSLEKKGQMIGGMDLLIAAHTLSLGAVLISNNLREFSRVPNLVVENWSE